MCVFIFVPVFWPVPAIWFSAFGLCVVYAARLRNTYWVGYTQRMMFAQSRGKSHLRVADLLTTSLRVAVMLGCVVVCLIFTSLPVTAQEKPVTEDRSLIDKARDGDLEGVRLEILAGANVNERGIKDGTALHAAADWGHAHVVRALLELGAQPDRRDANRATALSLAARRGNTEVVAILLAGGADPNRVAQDNEVPLISAARLGFHQVVGTLLAAGADPEETDSTGRTARDWASILRLQQVLLALDKAEAAR